ncbi:ABC transporter (plasmid) [Opitutaceae bacterium TAV5]|nr:ABC transporter [Opitutaceae bacterium TAV5]
MLSARSLTVTAPGNTSRILLRNINADFAPDGLHAIIGPSGCGKTTLVKALLGIFPSTDGLVSFEDHPVNTNDDLVGRIGFAPQFSIANPRLTVAETLAGTLDLFVTNGRLKKERREAILETTGLMSVRDTLAGDLSGGQLRRLGLALELVNNPSWLVCDEVTSGLDPKSEDHILSVLRTLADHDGKTFLCIIHNLSKLPLFDRITTLFQGEVVFQGDFNGFLQHFEITDPLHLYDRLNAQPVEYWREKWRGETGGASVQAHTLHRPDVDSAAWQRVSSRPGLISQILTLLSRRWRLFCRDRGALGLLAGITFGFPVLVAIFSLGGLPQINGLILDSLGSFIEGLQENLRYQREAAQAANLVVGLILFQVILLGLTGANNGAREIASERRVFEKERMNGLRPAAYAWSKVIFFSLLAAAQGLWMAAFVKGVCRFPGDWSVQLVILAASCISMTLVSLAISAMSHSAEKASFVSVFLVGLQLPLSGVVLALPSYLLWVCRPFINAFWAWAGYLNAMNHTRFYDAFRLNNDRWLPGSGFALSMLGVQAIAAVAILFYGCRARRIC